MMSLLWMLVDNILLCILSENEIALHTHHMSAMAPHFHLPFLFFFLVSSSVGALIRQPCQPKNGCNTPPLIVMGASMVDVGENAIAMPLRSRSEFPPYGMDYFSRPAARFSNGRLLIDFISQAMGHGLLDPYFKSVGSNFRHGVNFASSGSTAQNSTLAGDGSSSSGLFSLQVQVSQFLHFKEAVMQSRSTRHARLPGEKLLPSFKDLSKAVYFIETGHNDYLHAFSPQPFDMNGLVAAVISAIEGALKELYQAGARNIIVMNLIPLGCTPGVLTKFDDQDLDEYGCYIKFNDLVRLHNQHLHQLIDLLREELPLAKLIIFDAHSIMLDAYINPSKYGVKYPHRACCGAGGKYNFVESIQCGQRGYVGKNYLEAKKCEDPSHHIIWDFIHPVESFAYHMAMEVVNGTYLQSQSNISDSYSSINDVFIYGILGRNPKCT